MYPFIHIQLCPLLINASSSYMLTPMLTSYDIQILYIYL